MGGVTKQAFLPTSARPPQYGSAGPSSKKRSQEVWRILSGEHFSSTNARLRAYWSFFQVLSVSKIVLLIAQFASRLRVAERFLSASASHCRVVEVTSCQPNEPRTWIETMTTRLRTTILRMTETRGRPNECAHLPINRMGLETVDAVEPVRYHLTLQQICSPCLPVQVQSSKSGIGSKKTRTCSRQSRP
eukprot:COSAG02_NODE_2251_length_9362_cov_19.062075_9_plen_189_part_00